MMTVAGFMPDLTSCRECGSDVDFPLFLHLSGGELVCSRCKATMQNSGDFIELDKTTFAAMRHIIYSPFDKIYKFSVPENNSRYLSFVTERYLLSQTAHRFKTLDFFHSLEARL
jgi:DNA repair protein RecO (recombination protein O)